MAIEDAVVIGHLLGHLIEDFPPETLRYKVPSLLKLYERMRKPRTTLNVQGALVNRKMNHLHDGPDQLQRDADLKNADYLSPNPWESADGPYQKQLLGFDITKDCEEKYIAWRREQKDVVCVKADHVSNGMVKDCA